MDAQPLTEWPFLVRIKIFGFLDANDLLRCSRVSHAWRSTILDSVEISSLSCKEKVGRFHEMRYLFNFESIESDRFLFADDLKFLQSESLQTILQRSLKKLYIHHPVGYIGEKSRQSLVPVLNQLVQLEQLQLNVLQVTAKAELTLPNLLCLSIANFIKTSDFKQLKLNTPKLTSFSTGDFCTEHFGKLSDFKFEYPAQIVRLDVRDYERDLMKFVNLEILYCEGFDMDKVVRDKVVHDFLAALPKLRQLQSWYICGRTVCQLLSSKCKLRRLDFNFYFCGFRIDTINELDEYFDWKGEFEMDWKVNGFEVMLSNPCKLSQHIRYLREIYDYERLVRCFNRISFARFFGKFVKMEEVKIKCPVTDEPKLVEFLKACKFITDLSIKNTTTSQSLFDRLPIYQPYIDRLSINEEAELDLQFVLKFDYLQSFSTDQKVSMDFISRAFRELKLLKTLYIRSDDKWFKIGRKSICHGGNAFEFHGETPMLTALEDFFRCFA